VSRTATEATTPTRTATTQTPIATPTTRASAAAAESCLEPVGLDEFLSDYWERQPLTVSRNEPGRFDGLLSPASLDRLLCSGGLRYPAFRLVKEGTKLDVRDYAVDLPWRPVPFAGTADVDRVLAEFAAGATIVLQGLHLHHPPLARFCRALEQAFEHPVQANAYSTPRASQGLGVHHDTHDVICLQVAGEKRWLVYEPVFELPLRDQRYDSEMGAPGEPVLDLVLRPGDTLYLPRGWLHEALTSEADSLHLTLGVNPHTWIDAVRAAVDDCAGELAFRRSVPRSGETADDLLALLAERLRPEQIARRRRERLVRGRRPIREDELAQLRALDRLALDTEVKRRETVIADIRAGDDVRLAFEGKELVLPEHVREEVEFALSAEATFCALDLPGGLDGASRLVLLRRLVREGFLRLVDTSRAR
jgi:ribosomal protein L16 Arg81 hydroxylase